MTIQAQVVDMHSHFFPMLSQQQAAQLSETNAPWLKVLGNGKGMIMHGNREFRPVYDSLWDPVARISDMDRLGVDVQIMCATPVLFGYDAPIEKAVPWSQRVNDMAIDICQHQPQRLHTLCQVPLQDTEAACRELERARNCGHVGVQIGNHVGDRNLDDLELIAFLRFCAEQDMPVLVHPWDMMAPDRMPKYMLQWLVGMPAETHLGIMSLILSGALEQLPQSLKICFAHGGGNFAFQLGRVDNAWRERDIVRQDCPNLPSSYVDRFYMDSAVFSEEALTMLVSVMGAERVMLGSDYPFPLGERSPGALIRDAVSIPEHIQRAILADNTLNFFGISRSTMS